MFHFLELHSKNDTYACKVCNCFFLNQETLLVHKNTHHKNIMTQDILSEISDDVKPLLNAIKEEKHDNSVDSFSPENGKRRRGRPKQVFETTLIFSLMNSQYLVHWYVNLNIS